MGWEVGAMDFDRDRYSVWTWKNPVILHWILNPGLAVNELVLGQRMPATTLIDKASPEPLGERQYIPCPTCKTLNNGVIYEAASFGNYAGLVCAECGGVIPTLKNALSWLILMVTWPLWKPLERRFGQGLRARQFARLQKAKAAKADSAPVRPKLWEIFLDTGAKFGLFMGLFFVGSNVVDGDPWGEAIRSGMIAGLGAGVLFGGVMAVVQTMRGRRAPDQPG
jgi:hypothetical protein